MVAFIFPGQGSQAPGMGVALATRWPSVERRFAEAADVLGFDLARMCAEGPEERLAATEIAQPALFVAGYATYEVLAAEGVAAKFVAGHSLGEYTAGAAAGVLTFADGLKAVKARGEAMRDAAARRPGGMTAVIGAKAEELAAWVADAAGRGVAVVANQNSAEQVIVSGETPALEALEERCKAAGVRAVRLNVSGAFHSPLMQPAAETMAEVLAGLKFAEPRCALVGNVAGIVLTSARLVRDELASQLISAVRWEACVRTLAGNGVRLAVEAGPGRVLAGLIRRIDRTIKTFATGTPAELDEALTGAREAVRGPA